FPLTNEKQRAWPKDTVPQTGRVDRLSPRALEAPPNAAARIRARRRSAARIRVRPRAGNFEFIVLPSGVYLFQPVDATPQTATRARGCGNRKVGSRHERRRLESRAPKRDPESPGHPGVLE